MVMSSSPTESLFATSTWIDRFQPTHTIQTQIQIQIQIQQSELQLQYDDDVNLSLRVSLCDLNMD